MSRVSRQSAALDQSSQRVAELLSVLIGQAILFNERVARAIGMTAIDLQTFGIISRNGGPITPSEVAARTGLPASTTTRVLDRLEQSGYVVRSAVPTDRRKVAVDVVVEKAAEIAQHYTGKIDEVRELNAKRSEIEVAAVISYLEELIARDRA